MTRLAGKYRLLRLLGNGAMGVVWAAINENTEREVAIKLILGSPKNRDLRERLLREARASGRIAHRNVVEIYDVGETEEGQPFLVMQMLRGETLASWLERAGPLATATAAAILVDILRALIAAHAVGVVHRDLKPENVFLHQESDGFTVLKVVDFGVSKLLDSDDPTTSITGVPIGSPAYMSPEQARGARDVGPPSDMWAVGVILFEMLAERRPFAGATSCEVVKQVQQDNAPRLSSLVPGVDPAIDELVARCLDRTPAARPSASEALEALEPFVPPGELSSRRAFQLASPPVSPESSATPGALLTEPAAGQTTLADSASGPVTPAASKTRPSPASPPPEPAGQTAHGVATRSEPTAHDRPRAPGLLLAVGLPVMLLGAALRLQASPASAGSQPPATGSAPSPAASAAAPASAPALAASAPASAPPPAQASAPASAPPAASQAEQGAARDHGRGTATGADRGATKSKAPPRPSTGCPPGCAPLRGTCVDALELPCKR